MKCLDIIWYTSGTRLAKLSVADAAKIFGQQAPGKRPGLGGAGRVEVEGDGAHAPVAGLARFARPRA